MPDVKDIKEIVKKKYGDIARKQGSENCCGSSDCCSSGAPEYSAIGDNYEKINGYVAEADLGLGCGLPTEHGNIKPGDIVVDLGSGAGNDVFVARSMVGESGRVIGIDMTPEMIAQANINKDKLGFENVEFHHSEIENLPLERNSADVVISNCVLNLVPDKYRAFSEIHRILKPGGHFCVSDIVLKGSLPDDLRRSVEMYVGCIAGAIQKDDYLNVIKRSGFSGVEIKTSKAIRLTDEIFKDFITEKELEVYKNSQLDIFSITVVGYKPGHSDT
jgi:ubiquinone/menaquinone biosynthesis C-methylase UbiE